MIKLSLIVSLVSYRRQFDIVTSLKKTRMRINMVAKTWSRLFRTSGVRHRSAESAIKGSEGSFLSEFVWFLHLQIMHV